MSKMNKDTPKVFAIFLNSMILGTNVGLIEKAQHPFFQLATAFAGNDFYQFDALLDRFLNNPVQLCLDLTAAVVGV